MGAISSGELIVGKMFFQYFSIFSKIVTVETPLNVENQLRSTTLRIQSSLKID